MRFLRCARRLPALLLIALALLPLAAAAQESHGFLRDRIRQRLLERQQAKPAPAASTDVDSPITRPGTYTFSLQHDGLTRLYRVHVPPQYDGSTPLPLLVALHGGGGDMTLQADDRYYGQISQSDRRGFIVAFPNGYSAFASGKLATWNAGRCCAAARDRHVDDVGFIRAMVGHLAQQLHVDRRRVYATGMSNGAMLAYRLACEMPDTFRAIAAVAGTDNTTACAPQRPVSVLHIHAQDDDHVLFNGGAGATFRNEALVTDFVSVPDTIAKWARLDHCGAPARRTLDKPGAYCDLRAPCDGGTRVQLCVTATGGHSWPGGVKPRGGTEAPSQALSANDAMWEFFDALPRE